MKENQSPFQCPIRGRNHRIHYRLLLPILFLGALFPQAGWALRPLSCSVALVAGEGTAGFRDGDFTSAFFKKPMGMAVSSDGTRLFVADSGNNRIRVIHLDQNNIVTTLAGNDAPGNEDGPLASARFNQPQAVVCLAGERLVVYDYGNKRLRLVDLTQGIVTTLAGSSPMTLAEGPAAQVPMDGIRDMAYLPAADSLFFTQPEKGTLKRLDLKTGQVILVPTGAAGLGSPDALCTDGARLYVSVNEQTRVYGLDWKDGSLSNPVSLAATSGNVLALIQSGGYLYALQPGDQAPLQRLLPQNETVYFDSVWGDVIPNPGMWLSSFARMGEVPVGFVSDPLEPRKLYIVNPLSNIVTSFRDLYGNRDLEGNLRGSEPPLQKPPRTFRILLVGDSRVFMIVPWQFDTIYNVRRLDYPDYWRIQERLELELNILAALDDVPLNFEVVRENDSAATPLFLWPYYRLPKIVQNEDIDLVVFMQAPTPESVFPFIYYFFRPITPEGIPAANNDAEYMLKPPLRRIPDGTPRKFYDLCKAKQFVHVKDNNFVFDDGLFSDPEIHDSLVQLYGKPLDLLNQKLSTMKNSAGQPVRMLLWSTHTGLFRPNAEDPRIWVDVAKRFHIPLLDNNNEMTALLLSLYPLSETGGNDHLNPDGHTLFGRILAHDLIKNGFIPWNGKTTAPTP